MLGVLLRVTMHLALHTASQRMIMVGALSFGLAVLVPFALGQTNMEADIQPENLHNVSPLAGSMHLVLWCLAGLLVIILVVLTAMRYRMSTNLYKLASDAQWSEDAQADAGDQIDATEVIGACAAFEKTEEPAEAAQPAATPEPVHEGRVFTPASGAAWSESMLKAFLNTCVKVNCLGRTWRESAARQVQSSNQPDPREAELIRRLMQRWQQFHVDPDTGVFFEHSSPEGKSRVCVISVTKDKHTLREAAFNAGFVVESLGRYLRGTDLVYRRDSGDYHAPTKDELAAMTPGERESLIRITDIPDPWQAMIGSA